MGSRQRSEFRNEIVEFMILSSMILSFAPIIGDTHETLPNG
jgi:hypothetical protein